MILPQLILSIVMACQEPEATHDEKEGSSRSREELDKSDPKAVLERWDGDGDGVLSKEELPERLRTRFASIDINDDDVVEEDELKQMMLRRRAGRRGPGALMRKLMELDIDGDDRIHRDEIPVEMENLRAMFDDVDTNADDYLDAEEVAALQRRLERRRP